MDCLLIGNLVMILTNRSWQDLTRHTPEMSGELDKVVWGKGRIKKIVYTCSNTMQSVE